MSSARIYDYIDEKVLDEIIEVLNNDGLIIFPTDTVYGIACNSFSDKAIKKLYKAKNRSFDKPIGVLTDSISKIKSVVDEINSYEQELNAVQNTINGVNELIQTYERAKQAAI